MKNTRLKGYGNAGIEQNKLIRESVALALLITTQAVNSCGMKIMLRRTYEILMKITDQRLEVG